MLLLISMIRARDMTTNGCMVESPHFEIDVGDKHHCLSRASEKIRVSYADLDERLLRTLAELSSHRKCRLVREVSK